MKRKIFSIISIGNKDNIASRIFDILIACIIMTNIVVMFASTFDELNSLDYIFYNIEIITTIIFCIEYILRIWTADILYEKTGIKHPIIKFLMSYDGIVDLLTILPAFFLTGFVVFRMLRVVRIFHLFRLNIHYDSFNVITSVLNEKKNQIASSVFIVLILMLASSLCMYSIEHEAQPKVFKNAFCGIWYSMSTLLTVGYGDIYPITVTGKLFGIATAFLGVGLVAIPTGIISAGFVEQYQRKSDIAAYSNLDVKDIIEIKVDRDMHGKTIDDFDGLNIFLVIRDDLSILPKDSLVVHRNDIIIAKRL